MIRGLLAVLAVIIAIYVASRAPAPEGAASAPQPALRTGRGADQIKNDLEWATRLQSHWKEFSAGKRKDQVMPGTLEIVVRDLRSVPVGHPQHAEASAAADQLAAIEPAVRKAWQPVQERLERESAKQQAASRLAARRNFPNELEDRFLKRGYDFYITVDGPDATTLRFKYVLMSRPLVYQVGNDTDFLEQCRRMGFKKVVFTDGNRNTWSYDL